jgi:hypothetical protein
MREDCSYYYACCECYWNTMRHVERGAGCLLAQVVGDQSAEYTGPKYEMVNTKNVSVPQCSNAALVNWMHQQGYRHIQQCIAHHAQCTYVAASHGPRKGWYILRFKISRRGPVSKHNFRSKSINFHSRSLKLIESVKHTWENPGH